MNNRLPDFIRVTSALFMARSKEFYRDRGTLIWAFIFPVCIIAAIGFAFSSDEQGIFRTGVVNPAGDLSQAAKYLAAPWVKRIEYPDRGQALDRMRYHQLDLLLDGSEPGVYWINDLSVQSRTAEKLLLADTGGTMERRTVSGRRVRYVDWVIPGVLGMNIMFGSLFGIGYIIVRYRKNGVLKRLQVTPVTRLQFVTAQVLSRLVIMLASAAAVYIGCDLFLDFVMLGSYLDLFLITTLGSFSMIALALIVACRTASEELANGLLNLLTFPMMLLSEVWFSMDEAPPWLTVLSDCLPLTHMVQGARAIMIEGAGLGAISRHVWILGFMSIVFLVVAATLFRWNER